MLCPNCGNVTPDQGKFCINCGAKLEALLDNKNAWENDENKVSFISDGGNGNTDDARIIRQCRYIEVNNDMLDISLLDKDRVNEFKKSYFHEGKFCFSLGQYKILYSEEAITYINTVTYFSFVMDETISYCKENYKKNQDWESFLNLITWLYQDCLDRIASFTLKIMVASGIMSYTKDYIRDGLFLSHDSAFLQVLQLCAEQYDDIMLKYTTAENKRELDKMLSNSSSYIAGGFGFTGMLGGMAAAGVANAGSSLAHGIKNGMSKASNKAKMRKELNQVSKNPAILESILTDIRQCTSNAVLIYQEACRREYNYGFNNYTDKKMINLGDNTMEHIKDQETILENLSKVLSACPTKDGVLDFLIKNFYDNKEISEQILNLSKFLLHEEETLDYLEELKEEDLQNILELPENTITDIAVKIDSLTEKGKNLFYDVSKHTERLYLLLDQKKREEEEQRNCQARIDRMVADCLASAEKVDNAFKNNDMNTLGVLSAAGDIVAEERYIQYYISKIRATDDKHLFDAIAGQCGNNRAYDCIIGICCYNGFGSISDSKVAKELLLRSAQLGCTYAMGYMVHLLNSGKAEFLGENIVQKYHDIALEKMSPYTCMWEGKQFCQGTVEGGNNNVPNDYEKAIFYIQFAYKCGIEEAEDVYRYLIEHSAEEINTKKYTSDSGCYITTAVCNSFGKPDNCYELTAFRHFRDSYLLLTSEGKCLVKRYYEIAPQIVRHIEMLPERDYIYYEIWKKYLRKCLDDIQNNKLESCKVKYTEMVGKLEKRFLQI